MVRPQKVWFAHPVAQKQASGQVKTAYETLLHDMAAVYPITDEKTLQMYGLTPNKSLRMIIHGYTEIALNDAIWLLEPLEMNPEYLVTSAIKYGLHTDIICKAVM